MSRQMSTLIQQMLELARTDSAQPHAPLCTVDWSGVVTRAALPFASSFFEGGLTLTTQVEEGIQVKGEEETLRQVVEILLDNARKYVKPGGNTWVVLKRQGEGGASWRWRTRGSPSLRRSWRRSLSDFTGLTRPEAGRAASDWACPSHRGLCSATGGRSGPRAGVESTPSMWSCSVWTSKENPCGAAPAAPLFFLQIWGLISAPFQLVRL